MKFFYRLHGILVDRLYVKGPSLLTKASLWVVKWILDRYEMWQMRHYFRQQELIIKQYDLITKTSEESLILLGCIEDELERARTHLATKNKGGQQVGYFGWTMVPSTISALTRELRQLREAMELDREEKK